MKRKTKRIGVLATAIFLVCGNVDFVEAYNAALFQENSGGTLTTTKMYGDVDTSASYSVIADRLVVLGFVSDKVIGINTTNQYKLTLNTADVTSGAAGAVTGGNLYNELHLADGTYNYINQASTTGANLTALDAELQKRDVTKMTVGNGFMMGTSSSRDANNILNTTYTVSTDAATIEQDNTGFVTGDQIYDEIHVEDSESEDGIKAANTVAENLQALDAKVKTNTDTVAINTEAIENLKNMTNLTKEGETVLKNLAQGVVQVKEGDKSIVVAPDKDASTGNMTYKISVAQAKMEEGDTGIMTAGDAYTIFRSEGNYIGTGQTAVENLTKLDTQVKTNAESIIGLENRIGNKLDVVAGQINPVAAGTAALAALQPEAYSPENKWSFAVGYGHYKNANATAMGIFFKPEAMATFSAGSTIESGDLMLHAGASFKAGRADTESKKQEAKAPMQRLRELEAAVSKQETAMGVPVARMAKWEEDYTMQVKRLAALEASHKALQADCDAQVAMNRAQEKELKLLQANRKKIKAEWAKAKEQVMLLLSQMEMGKGEGK